MEPRTDGACPVETTTPVPKPTEDVGPTPVDTATRLLMGVVRAAIAALLLDTPATGRAPTYGGTRMPRAADGIRVSDAILKGQVRPPTAKACGLEVADGLPTSRPVPRCSGVDQDRRSMRCPPDPEGEQVLVPYFCRRESVPNPGLLSRRPGSR